MNEFGNLFARNLNYFIDLNNKAQTDLSKDLKISKATVSTWCNGTRIPRMDKVDLLCGYFNIKRSDLIEDRTEKQEEKGYYLNMETQQMLETMQINPQLKILFDASSKLEPSDIDYVLHLVERLKKEGKIEK